MISQWCIELGLLTIYQPIFKGVFLVIDVKSSVIVGSDVIFCQLYECAQIARTLVSISIRYRPDTKMSDQSLTDVDPMVLAIWGERELSWKNTRWAMRHGSVCRDKSHIVFHLPYAGMWYGSYHVTIFHMPRQLRCRDISKVMTWFVLSEMDPWS